MPLFLGPDNSGPSRVLIDSGEGERVLNYGTLDNSIGVMSQNDAFGKQAIVGGTGIIHDDGKVREIEENLKKYEQLFGADEDAFEQPTTTRKELWSYYLYYNVSLEKT